jgi:hypothetical protein
MKAEFLTLSFIIFHITRVISSPDEEEFARLLYILESYRGGGGGVTTRHALSISTMGFWTLMRCCSATAAAA